MNFPVLPSYPPSLQVALLSTRLALAGSALGRVSTPRCLRKAFPLPHLSYLRYRHGTMRVLTPASVHRRDRSPRFLRSTFPSFRPQPRDALNHRFRRHFSVVNQFQASPSPSRLAANIPPNRVRCPTDRQFASGCSPPRLTATPLPSATESVAYSDTDLHRADETPLRAYWERRLAAMNCGSGAPPRFRSPDRVEEDWCPPRPPNRTCSSPAYGSPVGSFLIGIGSPARGLRAW